MKTYPLSLSRNYVASWGLPEAVRELIQNALDSDSPFSYEFDKTEDGKIAISIQSAGITLAPSTLLLGTTSKKGDDHAIGSFGEGFKIALLVLTRMGYGVRIHNGSVLWTPAFEHSELFGDEMLVVQETGAPGANYLDLVFEVFGLSDEDASAVRDSCLLMQDMTQVRTAIVPHGEILLERPGVLYVGNLFVCKTGLAYGYNIRPQHMSLDRDRQTVSNYDLQKAVFDMWVDTGETAHVADMIDREVADVQYARYGGVPEAVKKACFELFRKRNPNALVAQSQEQLDRLQKETPHRAVRVNYAMYEAISGYAPYRQSYSVTPPPTPTQRLEGFYQKYGDEMTSEEHVDFEALIVESKNWTIE